MTDYILAAHAGGRTPNSNDDFDAWAKDHEKLLAKYGLYTGTRWARRVWRWIVKKVANPKSEESKTLNAQLYLEGMEVFRNVDPRFFFEDEQGQRHSVNTRESTHVQRQAGIRLLRQGIRFDIGRVERLEALDDWSLPYVKKYGDIPLVDQIRCDLEANG